MKKHFYPLEILFLFLFSVECVLVVSHYHKLYFWAAVSLVGAVSYVVEGARPYTPVFLGIALTDFLEWEVAQKGLLLVAILLVHYIKFYHISIVGKGPYNAGYRSYKREGDHPLELSVFYPSMSDGQHAKWIPSEKYEAVLYDIAFVDPTKLRLPYRLFQFIMSYLVRMKMPVLGDASLYVDDNQKEERWRVVVFSHGLGSNLNNYSALCGWWASHGYIVLSLQHHHDRVRIDFDKKLLSRHDILETMLYDSRNQDLHRRAAEMQAVLQQLQGNDLLLKVFPELQSMPIEEVYLAGHSFGAATALETLANLGGGEKAGVKGAICLDAWFFPLSESSYQGLKGENLLLLNSETFFTITPYFYYMEDKMRRLRDSNPTATILMIKNTDHLNTSDFTFAMGNLLQLLNTIRLQHLSEPILEFHQVVISLFMEGRSKQQIIALSHQYSHQTGLIRKGVELLEEWRYNQTK